MKRPPIVLGLAGLTVLLILGSFLIVVTQVNPGVSRNENEIRSQQLTLHSIICAQAQSTANAYRYRSLTPSGKVEPIRHFLTRMQAQQQTLRLSRGLGCESAPGFPPFRLQLRRALAQIHRILLSFDKRLRKPISLPMPTPTPVLPLIGDEGLPPPGQSLHGGLAPAIPPSPLSPPQKNVLPPAKPEPLPNIPAVPTSKPPVPHPPEEEPVARGPRPQNNGVELPEAVLPVLPSEGEETCHISVLGVKICVPVPVGE